MDGAIIIRGAHENNLRRVSLEIPKDAITVFTGVSGSGKSSLVFDTVAAEARRQLYATFPAFIRGQLPRLERPRADAIEGLTAPVVVDQRPVGGNSRSTVGTMTDIAPILRTLFARFGTPSAGVASAYSFNDPAGMCAACEGIGRALRVDEERIVDRSKSLDGGAILAPMHKPGNTDWQLHGRHPDLDPAKPLERYDAAEWDTLMYRTGGKVEITFKSGVLNVNYRGLVTKLTRKWLQRDASNPLSEKTRAQAAPFIADGACPDCDGTRLNAAARATEIAGRSIADWCAMQVGDLLEVVTELTDPQAASAAEAAQTALGRVEAIGLGYLSLDRATTTLSGGEGQRLKLVGCGLCVSTRGRRRIGAQGRPCCRWAFRPGGAGSGRAARCSTARRSSSLPSASTRCCTILSPESPPQPTPTACSQWRSHDAIAADGNVSVGGGEPVARPPSAARRHARRPATTRRLPGRTARRSSRPVRSG